MIVLESADQLEPGSAAGCKPSLKNQTEVNENGPALMQDNDQLPSQPQSYPPPANPQDVAWTDVQMNSLRFYRDYDHGHGYGQEPAPEPPKREFGMRDVLYAIFRHPFLILFSVIFISFGAYVYVVSQPNIYKSEARTLVNYSRLSTMMDPTGAGGSYLGMSRPPLDLRTEIGIIKSQALAEIVVDKLGPEKILVNLETPEPSALKTWLKRQLNFAEKHYTPRDRAVLRVKEGVIASINMGGSAVLVTEYLDGSPQRAQLVLQTLMEAYEKEHIRLNSIRVKPEYFSGRAKELKAQLEEAEASIAALLKKHNVSSMEEQKAILLGQIAANETEQTNVKASIKSLELRTAALAQLMKDMEAMAEAQPETAAPVTNQNDGTREIRNQLTQLMLEESSLMEIYTDQHPKLIEVRSKITRLKSMLPAPATNAAGESDPAATVKLTEGYRTLKIDYDTAMATLSGERDRLAGLTERLTRLRTNLTDISSIENEIAIRNRERNLLQERYEDFSRSQSQAEVAGVLDSEDVSNIKISQQATLPIEPMKSSRKMFAVLVMGVFGSVFVGIGLAVGLEFVNNTMKTNEEVEHALGTPVLITVPRQRYHLLPAREAESE